MEISGVTIRKMNREGKMKAIVSVTFDHVFVVHDIKIIEGNNGFFIAMPSRKSHDGTFKDIVHPITCGFREMLSAAVLDRYQEELSQLNAEQDLAEAEDDPGFDLSLSSDLKEPAGENPEQAAE